MMATCRKSQVMRCVKLLGELSMQLGVAVALADDAHEERSTLQTEIDARAASLAAALAAPRQFVHLHRHTVEQEGFFGSSEAETYRASFDPRLLTFEFMSTFLLRGQQVTLIRDFMSGVLRGTSTAPDGRSSCHQVRLPTIICLPLECPPSAHRVPSALDGT